jgi:hypothetical protein
VRQPSLHLVHAPWRMVSRTERSWCFPCYYYCDSATSVLVVKHFLGVLCSPVQPMARLPRQKAEPGRGDGAPAIPFALQEQACQDS